jgi:hypothetical protein
LKGFWQISAAKMNWHALCIAWGIGGWSPVTGSKTMTFNTSNLQQLAVSVIGALFASSIFISAAIGPITPFF